VDFSHYSGEPVELAIELVNTLDVVTGDDRLGQPSDVTRLIAAHQEDWCGPGWEPTVRDLREVRALRARLREVFAAPDARTAAGLLNEELADVVATPRVSLHGDEPHLHFEPVQASPARWLGAITAMGLAVALIEGGFDRLGVCGSTSCDDVFVDTSRNRSKHYCSDTCTTRENVAAFRARKRGG
jgi:predicted RNA-binding Zn ribbon-like protein